MLAYVFWHWPQPYIPQEEYEWRLAGFHKGLNENRPAGVQRSCTWRVDHASWLPRGLAYEDWYLLDDSRTLDVINTAVVSGVLQPLHDPIAALAAGGTAGLYQPARVTRAAVSAPIAVWFAKSDGMSYAHLYSVLDAIETATAARLWQRMLVLGPTPEFCLLQEEGGSPLPADWPSITVARSPVWPVPPEPQ
jgi:hypothetical protein